MNNIVLINIIRFIIFFLFQVLILKRASIGWQGIFYINILLYPLFILLLPFRTPNALLVLLGFVLGMAVDIGYGTPGVHTSALLFTAYLRPFVINLLEPREGYNVNQSPNLHDMNLPWFMRYAGILLAIHIFIYFSVDAFSPVFWQQILLKTLQTFIITFSIVLLTMLLTNPKN
jgi:hypothetical protein